MSASMIRRGLELLSDDIKGKLSTVTTVSLASWVIPTLRCIFCPYEISVLISCKVWIPKALSIMSGVMYLKNTKIWILKGNFMHF